MRNSTLVRLLVSAVLIPMAVSAQVIDLTIHDVGLAIGDKPRMTGLRINFRDRRLQQIDGINLTLWQPYEPATGVVNGLALGVPVTGARDINGAMLAAFGGGVEHSLTGLAVGGLGVGGGGDLKGILLGGVGVGAGGRVTGLSVGGIGVGGGGSLRGIQIGGIGVGGGGDLSGISIGGIGVGSAGRVSGLAIGGVGVGGGADFRGLGIAGIGVGGTRLEGLMIGGLGAGAENAHAIVLAGGYFKISDGGRFDGGALAAVNNVQGAQHGLTIGLFNYSRELHGAQVGLINVSDNGGSRRVIPLLSIR